MCLCPNHLIPQLNSEYVPMSKSYLFSQFVRECVPMSKEGNVLFNDSLNTFYLRLYGVGLPMSKSSYFTI